VILLLIVTLLSAACSKPLAVGKLTEIVVLADDEVWEKIETDIRGALEREILSTRPETAFRIYHASLHNPGKFRKWSKLILVGSLEGGGPLTDLIPGDVRDEVMEKGGLLYSTPDLWARNQLAFFLVTAKREEIPRYVRHSRELIFSKVDDLLRGEIRERMFQSGPNEQLEESLWKELGFNFSLPVVYRQDKFTNAPRTVRFFNLNPQRSLVVYWEDGLRDSLERDAVITKRAELIERFYPGDYPVEGKTQTEWVDFKGHHALKLSGLWENRERLEGGVFVTHAFNCQESARFFILDTVLFSPDPKKSKYVYMVQMETIIDSFRCSDAPDELR
jgi:hypothetical protein